MHALNMGREYSDPFRGLGRSYPDEIGQLCGFVCMLGCAFSLGIGQAISICGDYGVNFAACFTCHSREKLRRWAHPLHTPSGLMLTHDQHAHSRQSSEKVSTCIKGNSYLMAKSVLHNGAEVRRHLQVLGGSVKAVTVRDTARLSAPCTVA